MNDKLSYRCHVAHHHHVRDRDNTIVILVVLSTVSDIIASQNAYIADFDKLL